MSGYNPSSFEDRLKLGELRRTLTTHVVSIAVIVNAIPLSVRLIFGLPRAEDHTLFWVLLFVGWAAAGTSVFFGLLFEALAPRWIRDGETKRREKWMDVSYPAAIGTLGVASICFFAALAYAFVCGSEFEIPQ